mgnify:CR=1 FL=1
MGKKMGLGLSIALIVIGIAVVCLMIFSSQKTTYFGYMNSNTNAEKVVSEKDGLVKHNIKVEPSNDFKPNKGDFGNTFYKPEIVNHDDVPHALMMKIHDMHMN